MPSIAEFIKITVISTRFKIWKQILEEIKKGVWKLSRNGKPF
jgi:hypothetical protein